MASWDYPFQSTALLCHRLTRPHITEILRPPEVIYNIWKSVVQTHVKVAIFQAMLQRYSRGHFENFKHFERFTTH